jgi:predicted nucleic acid-binding protein
MKRYLADTNVLSELLKKRPHPSVQERLDALPPSRLFASEITRLELRFGTCLVPGGEGLWQRIEDSILPRVSWVSFDEASSLATAELLARLRQAGTPIGPWDTCLAGTALAHKLTFSTRNASHFRRVPGLRVENWFTD